VASYGIYNPAFIYINSLRNSKIAFSKDISIQNTVTKPKGGAPSGQSVATLLHTPLRGNNMQPTNQSICWSTKSDHKWFLLIKAAMLFWKDVYNVVNDDADGVVGYDHKGGLHLCLQSWDCSVIGI